MKTTRAIGLILLCILFRSLHASVDDNQQEYNEDYDDEEYDYSLDDILKETEIKVNTTTTTTTTQAPSRSSSTPKNNVNINPELSTGVFIELLNENYHCPQKCRCNYDFTIVNCKLQNFENVPLDLPVIVEKLDLSSNKISKLDTRNFENCTNLKELILDNNNLANLDFKNIKGLGKLEYLSLVNNHLEKIDPNTFSTLVTLKTLNLSSNPIGIPPTLPTANGEENTLTHSFLNQPNLRELNLNGCKVQGIHENMLKNTSDLMSLDLGNNQFTEPIDTKAFVPMKNLMKLKLPELEPTIISQLCKTLTTIDAISLPAYDVSCFELETGSSFDDSTIRTRIQAGGGGGGIAVNDMQRSNDVGGDNTGVLKTFTSRDESSRVDKTGEKSISAVEQESTTRRSRPLGMGTQRRNSTQSEMIANSTTAPIDQQTGEPEDEEDYKVAISSQTINHILIGIIIVAVVGIIIGIICRRDICGIKTKMCRTRRPPPTDQVRPAEEIPLNKV